MKKVSISLILISILFASCSAPSEPEESYTVVYTVQGSARFCDVSVINEQGGVSEFASVRLPWDYEFQGTKSKGTFLSVTAKNVWTEGTVYSTILLNGRIWKQTFSEGAGVLAVANGTID